MRPVLTRGRTTSTSRLRSSSRSFSVEISDRVDTKPASVRAARTSGNSNRRSTARSVIASCSSCVRASRLSAIARRSARFSSLSDSSTEYIGTDVSFLFQHGDGSHGELASSRRGSHQERGHRLAGKWVSESASIESVALGFGQRGERGARHYTRKPSGTIKRLIAHASEAL